MRWWRRIVSRLHPDEEHTERLVRDEDVGPPPNDDVDADEMGEPDDDVRTMFARGGGDE